MPETKKITGDIFVKFTDGHSETFRQSTATVYTLSGVLHITDAQNVEFLYSQAYWGSISTESPTPAKKATRLR
ncbi:hypothetical protein SEA_RUTHY_67 [Gordonia phage Ruthy]|uniref:Uncharacterized protein n=1 Tax=Gordonia phage Ruthy TaxID=2250323 RepID=A0A345L5H8_9CAUD|nr:hypothetical protein HOT73_gp67 [Gordonia phage Ruthy]AXH50530.1 hypothetical protein SEA_RUTHY_67 [Gordonia phage Ruthy]